MILPSIRKDILGELDKLGRSDQHRVLDFARALAGGESPGTPGKELIRFAGVLSAEDAEEMDRAIAEGCERVNLDEW